MPIVFEKQKKTQRNLILILSGVLLITIIVLWQGFFKKEEGKEIIPESIILPKKEIKINFEILKNPRLEKLQLFSDIEPFKETPPPKGKPEEKLGRENPFLSY